MAAAAQAPASASVPPAGSRLRGLRPWAGIFLATVAAYAPALRAGFIWDDDGHVTRPALQSLHGLWRIWFELGATQQYYPVLHSAFWLEHELWGDAPAGYHLLNVLLHALAAGLFAAALRRLAVPGAWAAGLIFALHPVGVESVAWISEQKNTLSTVFYLLAALAYWRFEERRDAKTYAGALALFCLALGSKTVTATLPAALLVVAWWRRGRLSWRGDVLPLAPWLAAGAAAGGLTSWVEHAYIGARGLSFDLSIPVRGLLAGRVAVFYLGKLLWPANLVFIYPRWTMDAGAWRQYVPSALVLGLLFAAFRLRRRSRAPLAVLLLFLGTLFPALGFINVYPFVFSYVADHFQYLASLSVIAGASAAATGLLGRWPGGAPGRRAGFVLLAALALGLGALTWRQARVYRDGETLYRAVLSRNPRCWLADDNLGVILAARGRIDEAAGYYRAALALNPDYPQTYNNLGDALARERRWDDAFACYAEAVRRWPGFDEAETNWGNALVDAGRFPEAVDRFEAALRIDAGNPAAEYGLANALANAGRLEEAVDHYRAALRLRPDFPEAHANLGLALATTGRLPEARAELDAALRLRPRYAEAHAYLGLVFAQSGRWGAAESEYRAALGINPNDRDVHYHLGQALQALGRPDEAAAEFEAASRRSGVPAEPGGGP